MPTRETTPEQREDAKRLKVIYQQWVKDTPKGEPKRTQDDVAEALEKGQSTVAQTLNGRLALTVERAIRLANLFGCAVGDFSPSLATVIGEPQATQAASRGTVVAHDGAAPLKLGQAVAAIGRAVQGLSVARRRMIASAAAEIIESGGDVSEDMAAALDDLGGSVAVTGLLPEHAAGQPVPTNEDWRELRKRTMRLAEKTRSPAKRKQAEQLLRQLDETMRDLAETEKQSETRHGNNSPTNSPG